MHTHRVPRVSHPRNRDAPGVVPDDVISTGHEDRGVTHHLHNAHIVHLRAAKYKRRYSTKGAKCVLVFPTVPTTQTDIRTLSPLPRASNGHAIVYGSRGR